MGGRKKAAGIGRFLWYLGAVPRCMVCRRILTWDEIAPGYAGCDVLCPDCRTRWEEEKLMPCPTCGQAAVDCVCLPPRLAEADETVLLRLGGYASDGAIGRLLLRLKDVPHRRAADFAAAQLVSAVRRFCAAADVQPETLLVTYLPRSRAARRRTGHDQAELLARALAKRLGAEMRPLLRRASGGEQKMLSAKERRENAGRAFVLASDASISGRVVLLCDDVVTTGASMEGGLNLLRAAGARAVVCLALAVSMNDFSSANEKNQK